METGNESSAKPAERSMKSHAGLSVRTILSDGILCSLQDDVSAG